MLHRNHSHQVCKETLSKVIPRIQCTRNIKFSTGKKCKPVNMFITCKMDSRGIHTPRSWFPVTPFLVFWSKQKCFPVGCVPPACWPYPSMHYVRGMYPPGGDCTCLGGIRAREVPAQGGVPAWEVPALGVYLPKGYLPGAVPARGVPAWGGTCQGVYLPGGYLLGGYLPRYSPL